MANAGCINAIGFDGTYLRTLDTLDSANIGVGVQYCIPAPLDDKRLDYIKYTDKCGCTCCITGENEILVYATNGVIKNFTLTNDDTNEVVKVKWNDLFGSNRAYTMVRYKTGSYPTSITDGTLAVKETTQNQYSVSGYNVSGLTDGTTYYFTAFAVSQDGTIIVVQNKTITPEFIYGGYQRVQYIENTGTSYINTGYIPTVNTEIETEISWGTQVETWGVFWGVTGNDRSSDGILGRIYNGYADRYNPRFCNTTYDATIITSMTLNTFRKIILKKNGGSVDGVAYTIATNSTPYQSAMDIFAGNNGGSHGRRCGQAKIKYFIISESGTVVKQFMPVYRKSDNVIGMLEIKSKTFFVNSGSGTFVKGPDIN